jgi:hypothetical protein
MRGMPAQPELPLRPMTLGELLDAAMTLLRTRAPLLLITSAVLAIGEQLLLAPARAGAYLSAPYYGPAGDHVGAWWAVTALGFGLEAAIITLLAALAGAALFGLPGRPLAAAGTAVLVGIICMISAYAGFLPWIFAYALFGLAGPALTVDRAANAIGRSAALASRSGLRGCRILLAGYLTWFAIRIALGAGWTEVAATVFGARPAWASWLAPVAWALADTVAYAALACVAAVLLRDIRIRTEGLDIAIRRGYDPAGRLGYLR